MRAALKRLVMWAWSHELLSDSAVDVVFALFGLKEY